MAEVKDEGRKTTVLRCQCVHERQDMLYGKYKRVFNKTSKDLGGLPVWRCTVCKKEQTAKEA